MSESPQAECRLQVTKKVSADGILLSDIENDRKGAEHGRELKQYILKEYTRLHSVMEQRKFMEKVRFLMMAGGISTG